MSDSSLTVFEFQSNRVRVVSIDGEPWFVAKDLCATLEVGNPSQALSRLDEDEKRVLSQKEIVILNDDPDTTRLLAVSESGMYSLVLSSRKPEAKAFKKWITSEVLPAIRKTGSYSAPQLSPAEQFLKIAEFMVEQERKAKELEAKLALEAQRSDRLEEIIKQHDAELDRVFNPDGNFYTVRGYASLKGFSLSMTEAIAFGRKATKLSKDLGYRKDEINDPRYGKIGAYSERVLEQIFA